jgi:predicted O-linked N-acetylglucosamine transferase (SPINDLY family)
LVPGARLLLKASGLDDGGVGGWMRGRLQAAGIDPARVEFLGRTAGTAEHLACYRRVDVALDTFPYHGTTTTCEALWMGVPVVTLEGDRHAARVGASLLAAVGHPEWVARSWSDYATVAAGLACGQAGSRPDRGALRAEMARSPLMDHAGQAARFFAALRQCWLDKAGVDRRAVA